MNNSMNKNMNNSMSDITKKEWLQQGNLLYRLHKGVNFDQIRVTQVNGVESVHEPFLAEKEVNKLKHILESYNSLYESLKEARDQIEEL